MNFIKTGLSFNRNIIWNVYFKHNIRYNILSIYQLLCFSNSNTNNNTTNNNGINSGIINKRINSTIKCFLGCNIVNINNNNSAIVIDKYNKIINNNNNHQYQRFNINSIYGYNYNNLTKCKFNNNSSLNYSTTRINLGSSQYSSVKQDPYEVLEVDRSATDKEIKLAYYKSAKKYHPDLNPNDIKAKRKFQILSDAYEILKDPIKKHQYDRDGFKNTNQTQPDKNTGNQEYQYEYHGNAEDTFRDVQNDAYIVKEAFAEYIVELEEEFSYASSCAMKGDWKEVGVVVNANKGLILGIVLPIVLTLRFPLLIGWALRASFAAGQVLFVALLRSGNLTYAANILWENIIKLAKDKKDRKKNRKEV